MDIQPALLAFATLLNNVTFLPFAAGLVIVLTALLKRFIPVSWNSGAVAIVLQVLIWVAYVVAKQLGYGDQFPTIIASITTIAGALAGLVGSSLVSTAVYTQAVIHDVPFIGFSRTLSPQVAAKKKALRLVVIPKDTTAQEALA